MFIIIIIILYFLFLSSSERESSPSSTLGRGGSARGRAKDDFVLFYYFLPETSAKCARGLANGGGQFFTKQNIVLSRGARRKARLIRGRSYSEVL